jgi:erythromycin esterase
MPAIRVLVAIALLSFAAAVHADWTSDLHFGIWPLAGYDPKLPNHDDLAPLGRMIGDARVAAVGEAFHTSGGFYLMKDRIFRYLVQEKGFRAFAIESSWSGADVANVYIQGNCAGGARAAISGHINVWQSEEYADMVQWMCEWNRGHSNPADKLALFGFDIQQPWTDGRTLIEYLTFIGIPQSDPRSQGIRQCEAVYDSHPFGQIPPERHETCLEALDGVKEHLTANKANIVARSSEVAFELALLRTVGLKAWENSVFTIAHDFAAGYNARDEGMAYAFNVMSNIKAPGAKTMIWADNSHVAKAPLPTGEIPIGTYLKRQFGVDYVTFGLAAYVSDIDYPTYGCGPATRHPGSVEDRLAALGEKALLVDARTSFLRRRGVWWMGGWQTLPHLQYDGIIWLEHSPKMEPYVWPSCD